MSIATSPIKKKKPLRTELPTGTNLCEHCTAKCCHYFAMPMETPAEPQDFDFMRWYLLHDRATVFVDEGTWYLLVHTTCKHLQPDHRCGIYETRPQICRDYSTDNCEYEDDTTYEQYFESAEQIHEFAEAVAAFKTRNVMRSRKPSLLPVLN